MTPLCAVRPRMRILARVGADIQDRRQPGLLADRAGDAGLDAVAVDAAAMRGRAVEHRLAPVGQRVVHVPRPLRRADLLEQALQRQQAREVGRVDGEIVDAVPRPSRGANVREHAVDLAEIAGEAQDGVAIGGEARPLGVVLDRRVPQERVADRGHGLLMLPGIRRLGGGPRSSPVRRLKIMTTASSRPGPRPASGRAASTSVS